MACWCVLPTMALVLRPRRWRAWRNDSLSLVLCSSLMAFLVVGTLNSWADEPRLSFLFYLLLIAGLMADARSVPAEHRTALIPPA